jgi:hypothetical protein
MNASTDLDAVYEAQIPIMDDVSLDLAVLSGLVEVITPKDLIKQTDGCIHS